MAVVHALSVRSFGRIGYRFLSGIGVATSNSHCIVLHWPGFVAICAVGRINCGIGGPGGPHGSAYISGLRSSSLQNLPGSRVDAILRSHFRAMRVDENGCLT
jgi:hypothetical protein